MLVVYLWRSTLVQYSYLSGSFEQFSFFGSHFIKSIHSSITVAKDCCLRIDFSYIELFQKAITAAYFN